MEPATPDHPAGDIRHSAEPPEHGSVRREKRDVLFSRAIWVLVAALVIGALELWGVWRFFENRRKHQDRIDASRYPLGQPESGRLPVSPRLEQVDRLAGITGESVRRRELSDEAFLASYGTTPEEGFIRIPIERAMDLVLDDLKSRKGDERPDMSKSNGLVGAGESNSGRLYRNRAP